MGTRIILLPTFSKPRKFLSNLCGSAPGTTFSLADRIKAVRTEGGAVRANWQPHFRLRTSSSVVFKASSDVAARSLMAFTMSSGESTV